MRKAYLDFKTTSRIGSALDQTPIDVKNASTVSIYHNAATVSLTGKTFLAGVAASLVNQGLTYTAVARGVAGNDIQIELVDPGANDATLAITVTGNLISVSLATNSGGTITTTRTQLQTALAADGNVTALVGISGSGATAITALTATNLASGVDSTVDVAANTITIADHGYVTGVVGQLTSTGTLPGGLSTTTDYWVIKVDDDTFQLASSLNNAVAGTAIDITDQGTSGATHTFTPSSLSGASVQLQKSNDLVTWFNVGSATNLTTNQNDVILEKIDPEYGYLRLQYAITAGILDVTQTVLAKGDF